MNIHDYWHAVLRQDATAMAAYFDPAACIRWHNTNEQFTVTEFVRANCEYPGSWSGDIEYLLTVQDQIVTVVHVFSLEHSQHFHVTSFLRIRDKKIISIDEYWGEDGTAPQWRKDMQLGRAIR